MNEYDVYIGEEKQYYPGTIIANSEQEAIAELKRYMDLWIWDIIVTQEEGWKHNPDGKKNKEDFMNSNFTAKQVIS